MWPPSRPHSSTCSVDDRRLTEADQERFSSAILPRYARRAPSVDNLIPTLYLKGCPAATSARRCRRSWERGRGSARPTSCGSRRPGDKFWADGIHVNVRLDAERSCILVIMGADEHGNKELVAVSDGYRESTASWREMLLDLPRRGLTVGPRLATADGALGFWAALREVYPGTEEHDVLVSQGRQRARQDAHSRCRARRRR